MDSTAPRAYAGKPEGLTSTTNESNMVSKLAVRTTGHKVAGLTNLKQASKMVSKWQDWQHGRARVDNSAATC